MTTLACLEHSGRFAHPASGYSLPSRTDTMSRFTFLLIALLLQPVVVAQDVGTAQLERERALLSQEFERIVKPLIGSHCLSCHDSETQEAKLDLSEFESIQDFSSRHQLWEEILERVGSGDMPPEDAEPALGERQRQAFGRWITRSREWAARQTAGDPGVVLARRLSNAEYDNCVRDLTGMDLRPTSTFPVDPANEAGFDNSGESLTMSPALLTKYLDAARLVVEHLVLTPRGLQFSSHPVVTDTDRDKYCVKRIVEFYQRQPTDYADYFFAAYTYEAGRSRNSNPADDREDLNALATQHGLSAKYLRLLWQRLTKDDSSEAKAPNGPMAGLLGLWNALPTMGKEGDVRAACVSMREFVIQERAKYEPKIDNLEISGVHKGSQPFVLWKNDQYAAYRRKPSDTAIRAALKEYSDTGSQETYVEQLREFCNLFPDAFFVSERGRDYLGKPRAEQEKGRLLSAGFHSMMGYYRDDRPLYDMVLDATSQRELDQLWEDLNFFAAAPIRQYQGFLWFDRTDSRFMRDPEFDFARPEDLTSLTEVNIRRLSEAYLAKATRNGGKHIPLQAIRDFFANINRQIRWVEQTRVAAESRHLDAALNFAARAYRRDLTEEEARDLRGYYRRLRDVDELSHDESIRDILVAVLMSPHFCYRVDMLSSDSNPRDLSDSELASRLSFFLWSSLPDEQLLQCASRGELHNPGVLLAQARRMMLDDRIEGLAREFAGNWLDFRRFEQHNGVDRQRYPSFDGSLRSAMFEEPIRFFIDVVHQDRSCLDFLFANRTFVNPPLAKHYGIDMHADGLQQWQQVDRADRFGRGGLLTMAVFMTKNAPGLRTSPVKRGYWLVRTLLGEHIPPPPPGVPDLPADESQLGERTLTETLAAHRAHASCSGCHNRIDPFGVVFEQYGPVGELRQVDLGGRPVEPRAKFPDGSEREGIAELRKYLRENRVRDFTDNLNRKLLAFALGRTLLLSDDALLQTMHENARSNDYKFSTLVETILTSEQFLTKRGRTPSKLAQAEGKQ